jgi:hypothetical protein
MSELINSRIEILSVAEIPRRLWGELGRIIEELVINHQRYCKVELDESQPGFGNTQVCPWWAVRFIGETN